MPLRVSYLLRKGHEICSLKIDLSFLTDLLMALLCRTSPLIMMALNETPKQISLSTSLSIWAKRMNLFFSAWKRTCCCFPFMGWSSGLLMEEHPMYQAACAAKEPEAPVALVRQTSPDISRNFQRPLCIIFISVFILSQSNPCQANHSSGWWCSPHRDSIGLCTALLPRYDWEFNRYFPDKSYQKEDQVLVESSPTTRQFGFVLVSSYLAVSFKWLTLS